MAPVSGAPYYAVMHHQQLTALALTLTMLAGTVGAFTAIFAGLWAARRSEKTRRAGRPTRRERPATR
jgi:hypothetical protein